MDKYIKNINPNAVKVLEKLIKSGYEAYLVGGCVRDSVMGIEPKDWDICTSATPLQVKMVFCGNKVLETGIKHGTVTVVYNSELFEVTTFRKDGEYEDGRRPSKIEYGNFVEDLSRRDFTINAMAADANGYIYDIFNAQFDIENKIVRCIGNPDKRFSEDYLRILRAIRFASVLGFKIHEETEESMLSNYKNIQALSKERVCSELIKILKGKNSYVVLEKYKEIFSFMIPYVQNMIGCEQNNIFHIYDVWGHTVKAIEYSVTSSKFPKDWADVYVKFALLFHDIGKPFSKTTDIQGHDHFYGHASKSAELTKEILKYFKFSNVFVDTVVELVQYHDIEFSPNKKCARKMLNKFGIEQIKRLLKIRECDNAAHSEFAYAKFEDSIRFFDCLMEVIEENSAFSLKDLKINGTDLINAGFKPGPKIGKILNSVLEAVTNEEIKNEKEDIWEYIKNGKRFF